MKQLSCKEQRTESKKGIVKKLKRLLKEQKEFDLTHFDVVLELRRIVMEEK